MKTSKLKITYLNRAETLSIQIKLIYNETVSHKIALVLFQNLYPLLQTTWSIRIKLTFGRINDVLLELMKNIYKII